MILNLRSEIGLQTRHIENPVGYYWKLRVDAEAAVPITNLVNWLASLAI